MKVHNFYLLRELKRKENVAQRGSWTHNFDVTQVLGAVDDNDWKQELQSASICWYLLMDREMEIGDI